MMLWFIISVILLAAYCLLILFYWYGYNRIPYSKELSPPGHTFSILIAARNEAANIGKCLDTILQQNYPKNYYEIIVINDKSEDNTAEIVTNYMHKHSNIRLLHTANEQIAGKKMAVTLGFKSATNDYCILTDADCSVPNTWLTAFNGFLVQNQTQFIYAPVTFTGKSLFEKIQSLEFAGLVGIGAAAIQLKNPNMCSAANMLVKKSAFSAVNGYEGNLEIGSGDDEYLLHKIFKKFPHQVYFLKSYQAIVQTGANATLKQLTDQRRRWVSKSTKYENRYITAVLVGAYLFNFSIALNLTYGIYNHWFLWLGVTQLVLKALTEGAFLFFVTKLFNKQKLLWLLPLAEPLHIVYVLVIGIWANINTYNWKGRDLN